MLQHAVAKAAGRCANIKTHFAAEIDPPVLQSFFEFQPSSADITEVVAKQSEGSSRVDGRTGFFDFLLIDQNFPGEYECLRAFAGGGQARDPPAICRDASSTDLWTFT